MDQSLTICSSAVPDMSRHLARERLEDRITELAAHIAAATCELLVLIGRYDAEKAGCSTAWLLRPLAAVALWHQPRRCARKVAWRGLPACTDLEALREGACPTPRYGP
jgi:hypothetical protein